MHPISNDITVSISINPGTREGLSSLEFSSDDIVKIIRSLEQNTAYGHAYCSRLNPGARGEHLAIQLSWIAPLLLVKRVCPVRLVERWGCSPGLSQWQ